MKTNARIREMLKQLNHWMTLETIETQGHAVDDISIYCTRVRRDEVLAVHLSFRAYDPQVECTPDNGKQQYWGSKFSIRDQLGNPTQIGKRMGIRARDRKISPSSPRGHAIFDFLNRMAWIEACDLTRDMHAIDDRTGYKARLEAERRRYQPN